jgi:hypothetical protein
MRWRVDSELFKNKDLACDERSLCIVFGRKYLHKTLASPTSYFSVLQLPK